MLEKHFPRLWSLEAGRVMVVTDLHGDGDAYRRCRDRFVDLHATGRADYLVLTGDLIHRSDGGPDESLEIVLDVLALQAAYGEAIIYLCGNHELPHIYGIDLARGNDSFTPPFEAALSRSGRRDEVMSLLYGLPFYLRTRAGISLTHAGAPAEITAPGQAQRLFTWNHREILLWTETIMGDEQSSAQMRRRLFRQYEALAAHYLAVDGTEDGRYNELLRGVLASQHPDFYGLLWPALFTRCEQEYGPGDYAIFLHTLLHELSVNFYPQDALVSGHINTQGGYQLTAGRQLRLSSATHAVPRSSGCYLLFDAAQPIKNVDALLTGIQRVFE